MCIGRPDRWDRNGYLWLHVTSGGRMAYDPVKGILWLYEMLCQGMEQLPGACINIGHIPVKLVVVIILRY